MDHLAGIRSRIRRIMAERKLSGRQLAALSKLKSESHVNTFIARGATSDIRVGTLLQIADGLELAPEYLLTGVQAPPPPKIMAEVDAHRSDAFGPAARAFMELEMFSDEAVSLVREMLVASYNTSHDWTPADWFEVLRDEHRKRLRAVRVRTAKR